MIFDLKLSLRIYLEYVHNTQKDCRFEIKKKVKKANANVKETKTFNKL